MRPMVPGVTMAGGDATGSDRTMIATRPARRQSIRPRGPGNLLAGAGRPPHPWGRPIARSIAPATLGREAADARQSWLGRHRGPGRGAGAGRRDLGAGPGAG